MINEPCNPTEGSGGHDSFFLVGGERSGFRRLGEAGVGCGMRGVQALLDWRGGRGGAALVVRNLLRELATRREFHWAISYRCMPASPVDVIWVVRGAADLAWAIRRKKAVGAAQLWAGPNIVVTPQEKEGILRSPEIDQVITPSDWTSAWYVREAPDPADQNRRAWPVGIPIRPIEAPERRRSVDVSSLYNKRQDGLLNAVTVCCFSSRRVRHRL